MTQDRMPFVEALVKYKEVGFVPFHTPGHKLGHGAPEVLNKWMGAALPYDLGVMYALDDLHEPEGVIKEAQELAAELYGADHTWFSINGTTAIIETMILATVGEGDEIILPREAHRSVISGLVLSGATPIYMESNYNEDWGITEGVRVEQFAALLEKHPKAKAVLFVYPNYYGLGVELEELVKLAHGKGLVVLVDEAHGAHLSFSEELPKSALSCGADLVAQSTHKLIGSLTQTSMLHGQGSRIDVRKVTQMHQMLQSTSPNYIFLASLDMARHQMAMEGEALVTQAVILADALRDGLKKISGVRTFLESRDRFDRTKVLIDFKEAGLNGVEAEKLLREEKIEVELVQGNHVLVLITLGDSEASIKALQRAVKKVAAEGRARKLALGKGSNSPISEGSTMSTFTSALPTPMVAMTPRKAFMGEKEYMPFKVALGLISGETVSYYPPGIPFLAMGEVITQEVIDYVNQKQGAGYLPNGCEDKSLKTILVMKEEL